MSQGGFACQPPPDVDTDDCLQEYSYLFSPDILKGKVAFITGGSSGIGFRIAEILMRHGCQTVIASRNVQRLTEAAQKLSAATGRRCLPLVLDVRQPQAILAAVDEALKEFERIDILVNNAAGNFLCPASSLSFNAFKTVIEIDTLGTFNVSKVLYEKCLRDHGGVIVNITATLSYKGQALQAHAGTAKAAIDAMTKHLAVEWGPNKIRVNCVAPGPISGTEGYRRLGDYNIDEQTSSGPRAKISCPDPPPIELPLGQHQIYHRNLAVQRREEQHRFSFKTSSTSTGRGKPPSKNPASAGREQDGDCPQRPVPSQPASLLCDGHDPGGGRRILDDLRERLPRTVGYCLKLC
ncbi:peroxisomal 2,4-dienoyl-CoA reductase [(3E)-enoyl-CoA-producing] isoform X2 [Elgaria multicarinata webbii]|uniref:peroxisomal 2,4-dienoyl-CoA reductase [(3E)-enoyl-CoA-producing] isoform X2 n=1 Tax=Elgaria multicarinata webbii TaxID=159646 RepID=UPI002FCD0D2D